MQINDIQATASVELTVVPAAAALPGSYVDTGIEASLRWLQSAPLDEEAKTAITRGVVDGGHKLLAFNFMLAMRRAGRLAQTQQWLDRIQDRLMSDEIMSQEANNPFYLLNVGRFLRDLQQDDTAFLQSLSKLDSDNLSAAKQAAEKREDIATDHSDAVAKIPPHKREKLRRMLDSLQGEEKLK